MLLEAQGGAIGQGRFLVTSVSFMATEEKKIYFISGLPRAGSTLLANILAQNPRFHATHTNAIADVMFGVRNQWNNLVEFKAHPDEEAKKRVLHAIIYAYFGNIDKPIIFDKSRSWVSLLEMAEEALGYKPKVLVPVRDLRDVLASFEKLWRKNSATRQIEQEGANYIQFQTIEGRCNVWMQNNQPVGLAYNRIRDAVVRGHLPYMHFVEFEELTAHPHKTMEKVYEFLGEKSYNHDFDKIKQVTWEDDNIHGIEGLHSIRTKVEPMEPQWPSILGHAAEPYANLEFWRKLQ
jgi:sulfotransferase